MNWPSLTGITYAQERHAADFYATPPECTDALLGFLRLPPNTIIWEPACGDGAISMVLSNAGHTVLSTDLHDYGFGSPGIDFLTSPPRHAEWIITNPPYRLADEFINRAVQNAEIGCAMLFKSQFWHSQIRTGLFHKHPPAFILPLTWRPDFHRGTRGKNPTMECLWTVWKKGYHAANYVPLSRPYPPPKRKRQGAKS